MDVLIERCAGLDFLEYRIGELDRRIEEVGCPFLAEILLLQTIPGVRIRSAEVILAEIGDDMSQGPTPPIDRLMGRALSGES